MININQRDFNKSMDSYISDRVQDKWTMSNISKKMYKLSAKFADYTIPKSLNDYQVHIEHKRQGILHRLFSRKTRKKQEELAEEIKNKPEDVKEEMEEIAEEYEILNEAEDSIEEKKENIFRKFINFLKPRNKDENISIEDVNALIAEKNPDNDLLSEEIKNDLKNMAKIAYSFINNFSDEKKEELKKSEQFFEYKKIIKKYGFIK